MKKRFLPNLLFSLLIPCLACALQWVFWDKFQPFLWLLFYPAVFFSAQVGGRWGGMAGTLLSACLAVFFFVEPIFSLHILNLNTLSSVLIFILMGFLFSNLQERFKQEQQKLQVSESALLKLNAELEARIDERARELQKNEQRFQSLFETMVQGVVYQNREGAIISANPAAERILGLTFAQMQGRTSIDPRWKAIHEDGSAFPGETHPAMLVLQTGQPVYNVVMGIYHVEAHAYVWINVNAIPRFNPGEALPDQVYVTFEDITERKRLEDSLRESEQKYTLLFEKSTVPTAVLKLPEVVIVDANEACEKLTGFTRQEMFGKTSVELGLVSQAKRQESLSRFERQGALTGNETSLVNKNGAERIVVANTTPVKIGAELYAITTMQDITERKQAEAALRESEARYRLIAENTADVIWVLDPLAQKFTYVSPSVEKMRGYTPEEVLAQPVSEALTPESLKLVSESLAANLPAFIARGSGTESFVSEVDQPCRDGSVVQTEVTTTYLFNEFGRVEIVGVSRNITERKRAEDALREREQKLNTLLNLLPVGVSILDQERKLVYANDALGKILDTTQAGLVRGDYHRRKYLRADGSEKPAEEFASTRAFAERTELHDQVTGVVKEDGQIVWTSVSAIPVDFPDWKVILVTADITERRRAEEQLRESEEFLRLAYEAANLGIWKNDLQTGSVEFDERARLQYGFETSQTTLAEVTNRIHPEDVARLGAEIAAATAPASDGKFSTEYRVIHPDGSVHWLAIGVRVTFAGEGAGRQAVMGYGTSLEITERKQADEALRQSEQKYSALFEKAAVPMALTKMPAGVFADVNEAFRASFGYSREELLEKTSVEIGMVRPAERAQSYFNLEKYGALQNSEKHLFTKAGEARIGAVNINKVLINGQSYAITTIHDVTERKNAEETLRQRTEELKQLLDLLPVAIWIADDPACQVIHGNRFANELLGVTEEDNISQSAEAPAVTLRQFSQGRELGPDELPMQAAARTGQPQLDFELQIDRPDQPTHILLGGAVPLFDPAGQPRGVVAAFHEITERKRVEDELRRSNAELEQFAYVASHDLQEPLRAVAGMVQLLRQRYQGQLDERADEYIGHAVEASQRMQNLINDLLDYSRVGRFGQPFIPVALESVLKTALANLQASVQETQAEITHAPLPIVLADPGQMTQVFQNLLGNALKFRGDRPPRIQLGAEKVEGAWRISVSDNGIGLEPQYFERIFLVFQRLHTRREYPGTGIGLALCKKIIERHGGKIWVESQPGQGSTFYFTLPERKA